MRRRLTSASTAPCLLDKILHAVQPPEVDDELDACYIDARPERARRHDYLLLAVRPRRGRLVFAPLLDGVVVGAIADPKSDALVLSIAVVEDDDTLPWP